MTENGSARQRLFARLEELGFATRTVEHEPAFTVCASDAMGLSLPGAHTKNLFLKDAKGKLFLIVAKSDTDVDLKSVRRRLGSARLTFGKPGLMREVLGVEPGSVTAFAVMNDTAGRISKVVLDAALASHDEINCHPMENSATTTIARRDLLGFFSASGFTPETMDLATESTPP